MSFSSSELAIPKSAMELLDFSGQSMPSVNRPPSGSSPGVSAAPSSTPCSYTPVVDILSESHVRIEPGDVDPEAYNTIVKIMKLVQKNNPDPDSRKPKDPQ